MVVRKLLEHILSLEGGKIMKRAVELAVVLTGVFAVHIFGSSVSAYYDDSDALEAAAVFDVSAVGAVVINGDTGTVLFEKNAYEKRAMASTTKIMTALLTAEAGDLDSRFTADSYAINVEGTSMGLKEGDIVTRRALLYGMLLPSGNDAANAAAVSIGGSMNGFVELMNQKAEELGLKATHFANPSGLDAEGHYTTAYDLAQLARYALDNPVFADICCCASAKVEFGNPPYLRTLSNSNKMLWQYEGCIGVKTGFTDNARRCLVSAAERDGVRIIAVTLNAPNDWIDHTKMLDYGFSRVKPAEIVLPAPLSVPVVGGCEKSVNLETAERIVLPLTEEESERVSFDISCQPFLYADVEKGETVGTVRVRFDDMVLGEFDLVAADEVRCDSAELGFFEKLWGILRRWLESN